MAVIEQPDEKWGERSLALVIIESKNSMPKQDIQDYVKMTIDMGSISTWVVPEVRIVDV